MKHSRRVLSCVICAVAAAAIAAPAKNVRDKDPFRDRGPAPGMTVTPVAKEPLPADLRHLVPPPPTLPPADTFHLAWYDWETGGLADRQGWVSVDRTAQLDTFWHVAGAAELDGGNGGALVPIEGVQSLWCGIDATLDPPYCGYATLPGYGNGWDQRFCSRTLACDSVRFCYKVRWDSEPGYDETVVQYRDAAADVWVTLAANGGAGLYDGTGELVECFTFEVPADSTALRFRFTSDGAWSDEDGLWPTDGAALIDSITVECYVGGVLDEVVFEDFEDEAPGARVTNDGVWTGKTPEPFGDFARLFPGTKLVQDADPCLRVYDFVWGFFDDPSITNWACGGYPEQGAIRYGPNTDGLYIDNEIWSPRIPLVGTGDEVILTYLMYGDHSFSIAGVGPNSSSLRSSSISNDDLIMDTYAVRSWVDGCPGPWMNSNFVFFGPPPRGWINRRTGLGSFIEPGAQEIQIALGVIDTCPYWCNIFGTGSCHSHAPLFSDVHVVRVNQTAPTFTVRHIDLFQDNFAADGTTTGTARADMANDIAPSNSPTIRPGDSVVVSVDGGANGLGTDPSTGVGPSVYVYVAVWPPGQAGKTGADIEAPETRAGVGLRYPFVDTIVHDGVTWHCFRADSAIASDGDVVADRYCVDLNDDLFTPGDTVCYFFGASDALGNSTYFSRWLDGQGDNFMTVNFGEAAGTPMEFTILPAGGWRRGGDILYVDDSDDRGGPVQLYFDTAFDLYDFGYATLRELIDRYDVLGPSSAAGNSLASRVTNAWQIIACYKIILWSSGNLSTGLIGDGTGNPEKSDDYGLLNQFLGVGAKGFYFSGDDIFEELNGLAGPSAINFRSRYMNYVLVDGNHVDAGARVSPTLEAVGPCFIHLGVPDTLIAYGGCPLINDFDVVAPTGPSRSNFVDEGGRVYMLRQRTPAGADSSSVLGSGFSYHYIHDKADADFPPARVEHLRDILICMENIIPKPVGIGDEPPLANRLNNAYPNPFNPVTTIRYSIAEPSHVTLRVYNVAGQLVRTLVDEAQTPSEDGFSVTWDGTGDGGGPVASGVYFYRLEASNFSQTRKMVLLK